MSALIVVIAIFSITAPFAITAAYRAGATSWRGVCVYVAESLAELLIRWARGQREYAEWRESRERGQA